MKTCSKCGTELKPGVPVCPLCETEVPIENVFETRFCYHCGVKIEQDADVCVKCGTLLKTPVIENKNARTYQTAAYVIMEIDLFLWVLGLIISTCYLFINELFMFSWIILPLLVGITVRVIATRYYARKLRYRIPAGVGFKLCVFFFINPIAGILMICDESDSQQINWQRKID